MKMIIMIMMRSRFPFRARHPLLSSRHYPQRINPRYPRTPRFRLVQWIQKRIDHHDNGTDDPQIVRCASIARAGWTWPMVLDLSMGSKLFLHLLSAFCFFYFPFTLFFSCFMRPLRRFYALLSSIQLALCFISSLFSRTPSYDSPSLFLYLSSLLNFEVHDSLHEQNPHSNFDIIMNIMSASGT